jgi:hypothetical protein
MQTISWRPAHAAGGTLRGAFHAEDYELVLVLQLRTFANKFVKMVFFLKMM